MASLGLGAAMPGGSQHGDVLSASPEDADGRLRLVEEIKSRGRHAVQTKNYRDADLLYSKAIEVTSPLLDEVDRAGQARKDLAVLYSNRSLSRLQMGQLAEARGDAETATDLDGTYVKGHWRLGQACGAMNEHADALAVFEAALKLDAGNKALKKEVDKARAKVEQEKLLVMEGKFDEGPSSGAVAKDPVSRPASKPATSAPKKSGSDVVKADKDGEFTKSDHVRGYKVIGGKKTSYFHHEQTEEEKRLIGDITPKQISAAATVSAEDATAAKDTSAWNKAGTWEEKDVTSWAVDTLTASLSGVSYSVPSGVSEIGGATVKVTKVAKLELHGGGHASVAAVRGKKRYIYEFGLKLSWELEGGSNGEDYSGAMTFPDVDGSVEAGDEYDLSEFTVTESSGGNKVRMALNKHVRDGGLRSEVHRAIDGWVELFRATY